MERLTVHVDPRLPIGQSPGGEGGRAYLIKYLGVHITKGLGALYWLCGEKENADIVSP